MLVVAILSQPTKAQENHTKDTLEDKSLVSYLKEGEISGHIRNYFLITENHGNMPETHTPLVHRSLN